MCYQFQLFTKHFRFDKNSVSIANHKNVYNAFMTGASINKSRIVLFVQYFSYNCQCIFYAFSSEMHDNLTKSGVDLKKKSQWCVCINITSMGLHWKTRPFHSILKAFFSCCNHVAYVVLHKRHKCASKQNSLVSRMFLSLLCRRNMDLRGTYDRFWWFHQSIIFNGKGTIRRCESWISLWFSGMPNPIGMKKKDQEK